MTRAAIEINVEGGFSVAQDFFRPDLLMKVEKLKRAKKAVAGVCGSIAGQQQSKVECDDMFRGGAGCIDQQTSSPATTIAGEKYSVGVIQRILQTILVRRRNA
jgi:hypothetical protein